MSLQMSIFNFTLQ